MGLYSDLMDYEWDIPSGKHTKNYGKIHHVEWENPLFRLGHFQYPLVMSK